MIFTDITFIGPFLFMIFTRITCIGPGCLGVLCNYNFNWISTPWLFEDSVIAYKSATIGSHLLSAKFERAVSTAAAVRLCWFLCQVCFSSCYHLAFLSV